MSKLHVLHALGESVMIVLLKMTYSPFKKNLKKKTEESHNTP